MTLSKFAQHRSQQIFYLRYTKNIPQNNKKANHKKNTSETKY